MFTKLEKYKRQQRQQKKIMTKKSYIAYKQMIQQQQISAIWMEDNTLQKKYNKWTEKVLKIKKKCMKEIKKEKNDKSISRLMRVNRNLKKEKQPNLSEKRKKLINNHIHKEKFQAYAKKVSKAVEKLRKNGGGF